MDKNLELRQKLKRGDKKQIAEFVGCSESMVRKVFSNTESRNHESRTGKKIIQAAEKLINSRESIMEQLN